jgi:hypothetical protein
MSDPFDGSHGPHDEDGVVYEDPWMWTEPDDQLRQITQPEESWLS